MSSIKYSIRIEIVCYRLLGFDSQGGSSWRGLHQETGLGPLTSCGSTSVLICFLRKSMEQLKRSLEESVVLKRVSRCSTSDSGSPSTINVWYLILLRVKNLPIWALRLTTDWLSFNCYCIGLRLSAGWDYAYNLRPRHHLPSLSLAAVD